ncbi:MAG: aminoacyl-tRNA hydrolase [Prolixibacteraceae bacterium]|jgi:ribosome-associated protein|nr:aminoacyl-tRNA hydrolase [Prolixibacteraceae bacterium]MBT6767241.1 aminoacyl-tRNA hydrolase [Prolixibacteraceae bacterium]MBT6998789.1 aminoacyl-tRNA hydrolase [Prolixibacteraceae bacterium]MBT7394947.1 aminoacyl-tRNA hydrolase [Prolixibacteraceae bacterium]
MIIPAEQKKKLETEFVFSATRSGGPGGQNVNKVNTQVELRFAIDISAFFSDKEKQLIHVKLKNRINSEGELILVSNSERTQLGNKETVTEKFFALIKKALIQKKRRIKSTPTAASRRKRLESKKITANKKQLRKPPET